MLKKSWLLPAILTIAFFTILLLAVKSSPEIETNTATCCKVNEQECIEKQKNNAPGEMIMESLSRQFLVVSPF